MHARLKRPLADRVHASSLPGSRTPRRQQAKTPFDDKGEPPQADPRPGAADWPGQARLACLPCLLLMACRRSRWDRRVSLLLFLVFAQKYRIYIHSIIHAVDGHMIVGIGPGVCAHAIISIYFYAYPLVTTAERADDEDSAGGTGHSLHLHEIHASQEASPTVTQELAPEFMGRQRPTCTGWE